MAAVETMSVQSIAEFYAGRSVFITGASGFIGKQLIEKLLRSCPNIGRIFLLLRSNKHQTASGRLQHILTSPLFAKVKLEQPDLESKLVVVDGNLEHVNLDIDESIRQRLFEEVSIVFHLAATVSFNEPLRVAVNLNIIGLHYVLNLCKQMTKLEAFIHTSTAYANCNRVEIAETVYAPPLKPEQILGAIEWMNDDVLKDITARIVGTWPNTYTFTKAIAEDLLLKERCNVPTAIFRPSIVTCSVKEPFSGWVDNYNGCTGVMTAIGSGFVKAVYGARHKVADLVPVDFTANALIAVGWRTATAKKCDEVLVYNYTSGALNPLTWHEIGQYVTFLFRKYPFENSTWIPKGYVTENSWWSRYSKYGDVYVKMMSIDLVRRIIGKKPKCYQTRTMVTKRLMRIHRTVCRMLVLMEFFTRREWVWSVDNVCHLRDQLSPSDRQIFNFDIRQVDWESYFENYCLGIRQYLLHQDLKSLPQCRRTLQWLFWLRRVAGVGLFMFCFRLAISRTETARWLWRFTMSAISAILQKMPKIVHS